MSAPSTAIAGLYAILDLPYPHPLDPAALAEAMIAGGARVLQLRAKHLSLEAQREQLRALGPLCAAAGVPLFVNDELALAREGLEGVSGVHLGQGDLHRLGSDPARARAELRRSNSMLGVSTHTLDQLRESLARTAPDYVGFGPVFATRTKARPDPVVGLARLARAVSSSPVPVVAIGGIDPERARGVAATGAAALAAIGALVGSTLDEVRERCEAISRAFDPSATPLI